MSLEKTCREHVKLTWCQTRPTVDLATSSSPIAPTVVRSRPSSAPPCAAMCCWWKSHISTISHILTLVVTQVAR